MKLRVIVVFGAVSCALFSLVEATDVDRALDYGGEIAKILANKLMGDFIGLHYFQQKYQSLDLQAIERNITRLVQAKANSLKEIFLDREDLVKKIAEEAEKLRNVSNLDPLTGENITFYHSLSTTNVTEGTSLEEDSNKIFYRNAKCQCSYQRPEDVEASRCTQPISGYERNGHFGNLPVSFENSSVHIPTEIYNEGPDVLKDIYLSHGIDEVMRNEVCKEGNHSRFSRFVYFTTQGGIMRVFPDRQWSDDCDTPDTYDSRIAPWYLNSVSSPKDITVLVDRSGSVGGSTLNLLRRSVRDFLDTVTTNDFINIVLFNEEASFINPECPGLLQATPRTKQILWNWMEDFKTKDEAFYEEGFNLTLSTLEYAQQPESHTAKCNPIVMFFTDGDSVYPEEAMSQWNEGKDKRVFSFTVGKNFYGKAITKEIACRNRGYSSTVPSFTATKESAYNYIIKLSEPLVEKEEKSARWTLPYQDKLGLGIVVSASVPVKETEDGREKVAGVVGTDILLDDLKKTVVEQDMGEDYYPFLIDNNGFVIIHPDLREASHDDILTVDFLELEHENLAQIRQNIINGNTGLISQSKDLTMDKKHLLSSSYTYGYTPLQGTVLRFGLAVHASKLKRLDSVTALRTHFPDLTFRKLVDEQKSDTAALLYSSPCVSRGATAFNPCESTNDTSDGVEPEQNFEDGLALQDFKADLCDSNSPIFNDLLLHAFLSDDLAAEQWEKNSTVTAGNGVLALFTALETPSFLRLKYLNFTQQTDGTIEKDDSTVMEEIKKVLANPKDGHYFRRSVHTHVQPNSASWTTYSFVESPVIEETTPETGMAETATTTNYESTPVPTTVSATTATMPGVRKVKPGYIVASRAIQIMPVASNVVPVVTGVVMHPDTFQKNIFNLAYKCSDTANCDSENWDLLCNNTENTECLILDSGGYLLSSNQEKHCDMINQFLGLVDGKFMQILIDENVYRQKYIYDYQGMCAKSEPDNSAGIRSCFVPTIADVLSFGWWLSSCARMFFYSFLQHMLMDFWSFIDLGYASVDQTTSSSQTKLVHCVLKTPVLSYGENSRGTHFGKFGCTESCKRSYTVVRIEQTNLLLAVSDTAAVCGGDCSIVAPFSNEDSDVTVEKTCRNETRYRKPPEEACYDVRKYPEELDSPCSSAVKITPLYTLCHLFITLSLFPIQKLIS